MSDAGIVHIEDLKRLKLIPSYSRMKAGPVVIVECIEEIPCDVCAATCPTRAITKKDINSIPSVNFDKCTGCGLCLLACPGLAIFLIDLSIGNGKGRVTMPYELLPTPNRGDKVMLLNRKGESVRESKIVKVVKSADKTYAVTVEVEENKIMDVRAFKVII